MEFTEADICVCKKKAVPLSSELEINDCVAAHTITADQEAFAAQLNTSGGRKTFKAYLWQVCGDEYDAQH